MQLGRLFVNLHACDYLKSWVSCGFVWCFWWTEIGRERSFGARRDSTGHPMILEINVWFLISAWLIYPGIGVLCASLFHESWELFDLSLWSQQVASNWFVYICLMQPSFTETFCTFFWSRHHVLGSGPGAVFDCFNRIWVSRHTRTEPSWSGLCGGSTQGCLGHRINPSRNSSCSVRWPVSQKVPVIRAIFSVRDGVKAGSRKSDSPYPFLFQKLLHLFTQPNWQNAGQAWIALR